MEDSEGFVVVHGQFVVERSQKTFSSSWMASSVELPEQPSRQPGRPPQRVYKEQLCSGAEDPCDFPQ